MGANSKAHYLRSSVNFKGDSKSSKDELYQQSKIQLHKTTPDLNNNDLIWMYIIQDENGNDVGKVWMSIMVNKKARIENIKIIPNFQRKGYGRSATQELRKLAKDKGIESIGLHAYGHNKIAINFYSAIGFDIKSVIFETVL